MCRDGCCTTILPTWFHYYHNPQLDHRLARSAREYDVPLIDRGRELPLDLYQTWMNTHLQQNSFNRLRASSYLFFIPSTKQKTWKVHFYRNYRSNWNISSFKVNEINKHVHISVYIANFFVFHFNWLITFCFSTYWIMCFVILNNFELIGQNIISVWTI